MTAPVLIVMRLAEMRRVHPRMIETTCGGCGERVGIYPSGQGVLASNPATLVRCNYCQDPTRATGLAPGAEFEPFESRRRES
jgi:ribosomal protein S27E